MRLMHAYFRTGKQAELLALLKQTDAFFHEKDRWNERRMASLAHSCLENKLSTQSVAYYKELIPLHQRTQPRRGIGNGTLSGYYAELAQAYAGLEKTPEAVDAAGGAIVSWGPTSRNRGAGPRELEAGAPRGARPGRLRRHLDKQNAESCRSSARRSARPTSSRAKYALAIAQLQLAAELQPNDAETQQLLITCYDKAGRQGGR